MSYTYATYTTALANLLVVDEAATDFVAILPSIIDYAEQRIYRDLDLLSTTVVDSSSTLTANNRTLTLPVPASGTYRVVDNINLLESDVRTPVTPSSMDVINLLWPSTAAASTSTRPTFFAMQTDQVVLFGPPSGSNVTIEVVGKIRPNPLSASNTTTYLSTYLPDLFMAASMIFGAGWQKNFNTAGDDPKAPGNWENQYRNLLASADTENQRAKFGGASWTSKPLMSQAQPQRG